MSTTTKITKKIIVLRSSDGENFNIEENAAKESQMIKNMIEDDCASTTIPIPNVTSRILAKVVEYCNRYVKKSEEEDLKPFYTEFLRVDQATLFEIILAANYLNIKTLLDLTCQAMADRIKDKSVEEVRTIFNIKNDFTPEEEEEIRRENAWAFT